MDGFFDIERRTEFWCNLPNSVLTRHAWCLQRTAAEIRPQRIVYREFYGGIYNTGKTFFTGDAWLIEPYGHDPAELLTTEGQSHVELADVLLAPSHRALNTYRQTTTPGAGQAGNLLMSGAPAFQRRRAAGALLSTGNLDADMTALPAPTDPGHGPAASLLIPVDRALSGTVSYPANQAFLLFLVIATGSAEKVCNFYFGGGTEVLPARQSGGQFCLALRGDGRGILSERDEEAAVWKVVFEFAWGARHASAQMGGMLEANSLFIVPYGRDHVACYNLGFGYLGPASSGGSMFGLLDVPSAVKAITGKEGKLNAPIRLFKHHSATDDHLHQKYMSGPGTIRMDRSRTDRLPFQIVALKYRTSGYVIDAPFFIDTNTLPLATGLTLTIDGYQPAGTSITGTVYDADTGVALLRTGALWLTNAGQRRYFAGFELRSDGDPAATPPVPAGQQTPVLRGYNVTCGPAFAPVAATPVKTARLKGVSINGCGLSPQEETASVQIVDEVDETAIIRVRDQMHSKLVLVRRDNGTPISVLFEGQTASPDATLRGAQDGLAYPSADWHDTDGRLTGMWPRLFRQFHRGMPVSFVNSEASAHPAQDAAGNWLPWRMTDALHLCFNNAGVPDAQLDVPSNPLRFPAAPDLGAGDYSVMPGVPYGKFLEELPRDYLGQLLIRDPNTGAIDSTGLPTGMWRLLINPAAGSANYLATIDVDAAPYSVDPYFVMAEGARGAGVWPIIRGTFKTRVKAPEGNSVTVYGQSRGDADSGTQLLTSYPLVNLASFDSSSPHYLEGETVPILRAPDPFLSNQAIVNWVARTIYARACFAEKWFECVIPLALVIDPSDPLQVLPRPLRINDLVRLRRNGILYPAIVRSCNPSWENSDNWQLCHLECNLRT